MYAQNKNNKNAYPTTVDSRNKLEFQSYKNSMEDTGF